MMQNAFAEVGWLIVSLLLIAGLIGIIGGRRGRRVGDHPHCRRCGFDLFGKPETSNHCPECGVDVTPARATVVGQRRPRRALLAVGVSLFLLSLLLLGAAGWQQAKQIEWIHHYPLGWILDDAADPSSSGYAAAWKELGHRAALPDLGDTERDRMISFILDIHADRNKAWKPQYDQVLQRLHKDQQWTQEHWDRFARNCVRVSLTTRPKLRIGGQPRADARCSIERVYEIGFDGEFVGRPILLRDQPVSNIPLKHASTRRDRLVGGTTFLTLDLRRDELSALPLGPHELDLAVDLKLRPRGSAGPVASFTAEAKTTFELISNDASEVDRVAPPDLVPAMESAWVTADAVRNDGQVFIRARLRSPPMPLAMALEARPAGGEHWTRIGTIQETDLTTDLWHGGPSRVDALLRATSVDIRLKPSDDALQTRLQSLSFWDRELIRTNVPVREPNERDLLRDESLRNAIEAEVWIERTEVSDSGKLLSVIVMTRRAPVPLHYLGIVKHDGESVSSLTPIQIPVLSGNSGFDRAGYGFYVMLPDPANPPKQVDIELRPVPNFGHANATDGPAWGGTLWFKDIPVPYENPR